LIVRIVTWYQHEHWRTLNDTPREQAKRDMIRTGRFINRFQDLALAVFLFSLLAPLLLLVRIVAWIGQGARSTAWVIKQRLGR